MGRKERGDDGIGKKEESKKEEFDNRSS